MLEENGLNYTQKSKSQKENLRITEHGADDWSDTNEELTSSWGWFMAAANLEPLSNNRNAPA